MRLGQFSAGYVTSVTIAAAIGFMAIAFVTKRFPRAPIIPAVGRSLHLA